MENKDFENLVTLLKLFKNRPYHLAQYLVENSAFNDKFIDIILKSSKLKELSKKSDVFLMSFNTISQMEDFYTSLIDTTDKTSEQIEIELNDKLIEHIEKEEYEEASRIRDYMKRKNIKKR